MPDLQKIKALLEQKYELYNQPSFIENDPIAVPHGYTVLQDIEITAFFTAVFAWGQRKTIINKAQELCSLMDNHPYDFILHHNEEDLKPFLHFRHRTFNATDTLYFIHALRQLYQKHNSLENAFLSPGHKSEINTEQMLIHFHNSFFPPGQFPQRTKKHLPSPAQKSTCKRINMFLRWMVRNDGRGVDFGIWKQISPAQLICPLDVHVERVARKFGLITRKQTDWHAAVELTENLKRFDADDPVKYDFALFGFGVLDRMA